MSRLHQSRWVSGPVPRRGGLCSAGFVRACGGLPVTNVITAAAPLPLRIADFQEVLGEPTVALAKLRDLCFSGERPGEAWGAEEGAGHGPGGGPGFQAAGCPAAEGHLGRCEAIPCRSRCEAAGKPRRAGAFGSPGSARPQRSPPGL